MGRPPLPKKQRRSEKITFRATAALRQALEKKAGQKKKSLGAYIASVLQDKIDEDERGK